MQIFISFRRGLDDVLRARIANALMVCLDRPELHFDEPFSSAAPHPEGSEGAGPSELAESGRASGHRRQDQLRIDFLDAVAIMAVCCPRPTTMYCGTLSGINSGFYETARDNDLISSRGELFARKEFNADTAIEYPRQRNFTLIIEYIPGRHVRVDADGISSFVERKSCKNGISVSGAGGGAFSGIDFINRAPSPHRSLLPRRLTGTDYNLLKSSTTYVVDVMAYIYCTSDSCSVAFGCAAVGGVFGCRPSSASVFPVRGDTIGMPPIAIRQERNMPRQSDTEAARSIPGPRSRERKRKIACEIIQLPSSRASDGIGAERSARLRCISTAGAETDTSSDPDDSPLLEEISLRNFGRNIDRLIADRAQERIQVRRNGRSRE